MLILKRRTIQDHDGGHEISVNSSVVASIPTHYLKHVRQFLWREDCLRLVLHLYNNVEIPRPLYNNLKLVLYYMDEIFKRFIAELSKGPDDDDDYLRSKTFDSYLRVEYWVGRHEPVHVREYRRSNDQNIDRGDITTLGECSPCFHCS